MPERDLYRVLGVSVGAAPAEIKRAYRRIAFTVHPDVGERPDSERFREIHEAYENGCMTSKYLKWISFSKVHTAWGSSHCCVVRWKSMLSAGAADLRRGERTSNVRTTILEF